VLNAWEKVGADGRIADPAIQKQVSDLLVALANWTAQLRRGAAPV
jgi:hypothetical protein